MAINITEAQKKVQIIQDALERCALLLSNDSFKLNGSSTTIKGLDLAASKSFATNAQELKEGKFKLMIMGPFKNGKSTTINAIIGEDLLPTRSTACTAIVTVVKGGEKTGKVTVFYKDKKPPITIPLEKFKEEYQISDEEIKQLSNEKEDSTQLDRFANVDHAETISANKLLKDGVQIIDSPGLEENFSREIATKSFVPRADAIIFELNATKLFSNKEMEYIQQHFYDKNATNIFFLVNRINNLQSREQLEQEIKPKVKNQLKHVFTDKYGRFNEDLYNRRVFYINALSAYCARTNTPFTAFVNGRDMEIPVTEEESGIPEFEKSLNYFLNSDERLLATFQSTLTSIAKTYKDSVKITSANQEARQKPLAQLEKNSRESQAKLKELQQNINNMRREIVNASDAISRKVFYSFLSFISDDLPKQWNAKEKEAKLGIWGLFQTCYTNLPYIHSEQSRKEKIKRIMEPLTDELNSFTKQEINNWSKGIPTLIAPQVEDLKGSLNCQIMEFDLGLEEATHIFTSGRVSAETPEIGVSGRLQQALALLNWDVSLAGEIGSAGSLNWGEFVKRVFVQFGLDALVFMIFGSVLLIPALVIEVISGCYRANKASEKIEDNIAQTTFKELRQKLSENEGEFVEKIKGKFTEQADVLTSQAQALVDEENNRQEKILAEKKYRQGNVQAEKQREDYITEEIRSSFNVVFEALHERKANMEDLNRLINSKK